MSFNKKHVPPLKDLKKQLTEHPESVKYYWNADALIGPGDSVDYIKYLWEEYQKEKAENQRSSTGEP